MSDDALYAARITENGIHSEKRREWTVVNYDTNTRRPAGIRHEVIIDAKDPRYVIAREVWFFSDNDEVHDVIERRIFFNNLVHLAINMTDAEAEFFSETRTKRPNSDWDGVITKAL
jgi:hypothetical protein